MRVSIKTTSCLALLFGFIVLLVQSGFAKEADSSNKRTLEFTYSVEVDPGPAGSGPVDIFVPLAQSDENQQIIERDIKASISGEEKTEEVYGNKFWHGHLDKSDGKPITVAVKYKVSRSVFRKNLPESLKDKNYHESDLKGEDLFLKANSKVPVSGSLIEKVQKDLPKTKNTPLVRSKVIYDYVVDNMEYKKVGTGWGNGDTYWACSEKYGNCTDFHALFISLARAEKIPAKFEIGFPVPETRGEGKVKGYHCWVTFKLPEVGWTPIDASEAKKNLERRELLFGTHPTDRIKFTVGRDLKLGEGHATKPLNYFIYPHVEVGGEKHKGVKTSFSFKDV